MNSVPLWRQWYSRAHARRGHHTSAATFRHGLYSWPVSAHGGGRSGRLTSAKAHLSISFSPANMRRKGVSQSFPNPARAIVALRGAHTGWADEWAGRLHPCRHAKAKPSLAGAPGLAASISFAAWADYVLRGRGGGFALRFCTGKGANLRGICTEFARFASTSC